MSTAAVAEVVRLDVRDRIETVQKKHPGRVYLSARNADLQRELGLASEDDGIFFFQAEDGIRDHCVTGVQTCALPIFGRAGEAAGRAGGARGAALLAAR